MLMPAIYVVLAFAAGFAVRRAGICLVKATHEIIERQPPKTMTFILQALFVSLLITMAASLFIPHSLHAAASFPLRPAMAAAALAYGIGIALNGTCAIGTMNALCSGRLPYLATIAGFFAGYSLFLTGGGAMPMALPLPPPAGAALPTAALVAILAIIVFLTSRQLLGAGRAGKTPWKKLFRNFLTGATDRDIFAVLALGLTSGALYLLGGEWDYTSWLMRFQQGLHDPAYHMPPHLGKTALALVAGILAATFLGGAFSLNPGRWPDYLKSFLGGMLMASGAGLIPGGNDTLILHALPGMALHAAPALALIMAGAGLALFIKKKWAKLFP